MVSVVMSCVAIRSAVLAMVCSAAASSFGPPQKQNGDALPIAQNQCPHRSRPHQHGGGVTACCGTGSVLAFTREPNSTGGRRMPSICARAVAAALWGLAAIGPMLATMPAAVADNLYYKGKRLT